MQRQLLERQQSGASASTSQSQHSQKAVTPPAAAEAASKLHNSTDGHMHASSIPAISARQQNSSNTTEGPLAVSASASSSHTQYPSPAQLTAGINSLEDQDIAAALSAVEAAQQHQPFDDIKVLGEEPAVPPSSPPLPLAGSPAQATASAVSSTRHDAQELEDATSIDLPLQRLNLQKESNLMPEALEVDSSSSSSSGLSQSEDGAINSLAGVQLSSTDNAFSSSVEGEPEGKVQKAVKAETLAFQASFAQAAAADKADRPAGADFAMAGQRTETWHAMRQGRLTASAFANALGYRLICFSG